MAWDFSTEPEFQKKLDWVDEFCKEEIEPLELLFPFAVRAKRSDPKMAELVDPLELIHGKETSPGERPGADVRARPQ